MNILIGGRRQGKTSHLIRMSAAGKGTIIAPTKQGARYIKTQANAMGLDIPEPINWSDFITPGRVHRGPFLLDELGEVLSMLGIKTATLNDNVSVERLPSQEDNLKN